MKIYRSIFILSIIFLAACSNSNEATEAELEQAADAARRDALKAVALKQSVMNCEKAIIAIRIRETELREHGFESCADTYRDVACSILKDSMIIE